MDSQKSHLSQSLKNYNRQSATLEINQKSAELEKQGKKIYRYGLGQSPFPVPESMVQRLSECAKEKDYLPTRGLKELREAIAEWFNRDGFNFKADDILVGPGSKQLLFIAGLVLDSQLVVNTPCWVSFIPQAAFIGKKIIMIHNKYENRWRLDHQQLDKVLTENKNQKVKVLILNYPDNPTGLTNSEQHLQKIATVCRKHGVIVISDQIYGKVHFEGKHCSIAKYYPQNTIISTGISKWAGAGGWRLGIFAFPANLHWMMKAMINIGSQTYSSVSAPIQYASIVAFKQSEEIQEYLVHERQILKPLANWIYNQITTKTKIKTWPSQGGFYSLIDFENYRQKLLQRGIKYSEDISTAILADSCIAILPGRDFGRDHNQLTLRIAFVNFDGQQALKALKEEKKKDAKKILDQEFLRKYCSNTLEGIQKIIQWTENL